MRVFNDAEGRDWTLDLNIASARPLSEFCKKSNPPVNLFDATSFLAAVGDILFAVDCLSVLTSEQRNKRGMTPADFGRALKGKYAYEAQRALTEEYADFFPDPATAGVIRNSLRRLSESSKREEEVVRKVMDQVIRQREERLEILSRSLDGGSASLPGSPDAAGSEPTISGSPTPNSTRSPKRATGRNGSGSPRARSTRTPT